MKVTVAFNLRTEDSEKQAELLSQEDVDRLCNTIRELKHISTSVEVLGRPNEVVENLLNS